MTPRPNFTPRAQQAINKAKSTAEVYYHKEVTLEHLFYGMIQLNAGILSEILFLLNIDRIQIKSQLEENFIQMPSVDELDTQPEYDEHFHLVLKVAASISDKLEHEYVGIEHILLALLKYEESSIPFYFSLHNKNEVRLIYLLIYLLHNKHHAHIQEKI